MEGYPVVEWLVCFRSRLIIHIPFAGSYVHCACLTTTKKKLFHHERLEHRLLKFHVPNWPWDAWEILLEMRVEDLKARAFSLAFPVYPHYTFGFTRSVQQSLAPSDPNQIQRHMAADLIMTAVQSVCCPPRPPRWFAAQGLTQSIQELFRTFWRVGEGQFSQSLVQINNKLKKLKRCSATGSGAAVEMNWFASGCLVLWFLNRTGSQMRTKLVLY